MEKIFHSNGLKGLSKIAKEIIALIPDDVHIMMLYGGLGSGKTTLIKNLCKHLFVTDSVSSPTFSIVNHYVTNTKQDIFHFDLYRIKDIEELYDIGFEEYILSSNSLCFIEWPEIAEPLIKGKVFNILISSDSNEIRHIKISENRRE